MEPQDVYESLLDALGILWDAKQRVLNERYTNGYAHVDSAYVYLREQAVGLLTQVGCLKV